MKKTAVRYLMGMSLAAGMLLSGCAETEEAGKDVIVVEREEATAVYEYDIVSSSDVVKTDKLRCTYRQMKQQDVSFVLDGKRVEKVYIKKGETVKKGELLAELSGGNLKRQIKQLEYTIARNELQLKYVKANEENDLAEKDAQELPEDVKEVDKETIQQNYRYRKEDLTDALELDRKQLAKLKAEEANSRVYAQMDGKVYFVKEGLEGSTSSKEEVVISIMDTEECLFEAKNPELAKFFTEGEKVELTTVYGNTNDAIVGERWHMEEWGDTQLFLVLSTPEGTDLEVGREATIELETGRRENVIAVPLSSLYNADGKTYVYVLTDDNMREVRWVETGLFGDDSVEIISGLEEGERVVKK